ncbi:MAG: hypothetical protein KC561_10560, partial [Myxococcales bacterium]|nr:hypothetical protein [Myxococcales bacterium]
GLGPVPPPSNAPEEIDFLQFEIEGAAIADLHHEVELTAEEYAGTENEIDEDALDNVDRNLDTGRLYADDPNTNALTHLEVAAIHFQLGVNRNVANAGRQVTGSSFDVRVAERASAQLDSLSVDISDELATTFDGTEAGSYDFSSIPSLSARIATQIPFLDEDGGSSLTDLEIAQLVADIYQLFNELQLARAQCLDVGLLEYGYAAVATALVDQFITNAADNVCDEEGNDHPLIVEARRRWDHLLDNADPYLDDFTASLNRGEFISGLTAGANYWTGIETETPIGGAPEAATAATYSVPCLIQHIYNAAYAGGHDSGFEQLPEMDICENWVGSTPCTGCPDVPLTDYLTCGLPPLEEE